MRVLAALIFLVGCVAAPAPARAGRRRAAPVVAKFGGECQGVSFRPSPRLKRLIEKARRETDYPCSGPYCDYAFVYDLDGDRRGELFVRLSCGATGNCTWGIFDYYPARSRGRIWAWFFYVHRRAGGWSALTTYERNGGENGVVYRYAYRRGRYVLRLYRRDMGYYENSHPFLKRMGVPKCS